jgi:predicted O-methyltransferase YrrM
MLDYIENISPIFDHIFKSIKKIGQNKDIPIIKDETLLYLITLLQIYNPKKILELGSGLAYSTHTFSKYSDKNTKITSIDLSIETIERCKDILSISNYIDKINWIHSDALEFLKNNKLDYDLYFIDALKSDYPNYFEEILKKGKGDYIILFDNLYMDGRVLDEKDLRGNIINQLNKKLFLNKRGQFNFLPIGDGLGVFIKNKEIK